MATARIRPVSHSRNSNVGMGNQTRARTHGDDGGIVDGKKSCSRFVEDVQGEGDSQRKPSAAKTVMPPRSMVFHGASLPAMASRRQQIGNGKPKTQPNDTQNGGQGAHRPVGGTPTLPEEEFAGELRTEVRL